MLSNLQEIKDLVSIRAVADYLGLEEEYGKRKFPGERTASIQLYKDNRFHDFGRNVDGDIFDLMIHVRGYTLKEAIAELKTAFNIKDSPVWENTVKEAWIAYLERKFNAKYIEHYDYFLIDQSGKAVYAYTKVRLQDKAGKKKLIYGMFNSDRFILGLQGKKAKDIPAIYGSSVFKIQEAIDRQETIFYVEGEKDVNTLMKKGYTVFTCGGSGDWKPDASILFQNANVIVLADNDEPGKKLASNVMKDLKGITRSIKVIVPMPDVTKADITDYFEAGHTVEEFENLIKTVDDKRGIILEYLEGKTQVCAREIWFDALEENIAPKSYQTSEINNIIAKVPGWQRMKTPRKFPKYGSQRGFQKMLLQTEQEETTNASDFVPVPEQEQMEIPFD